MAESNIILHIDLDQDRVPESLAWEATDAPEVGQHTTKAFALGIFDNDSRELIKIDLWTKDMEVEDMKYFVIQNISGLADTLLSATGDEDMHEEMLHCAERLSLIMQAKAKEAAKEGK